MALNIEVWLKNLSFSKESDRFWELKVNDNLFRVDISEEVIKYPEEIKIGRKTTTNFSSEENFVVLSAVINLIRQGYSAENIEIEKGYRLGHDTKSGNADITVHDNTGRTFMVIEAKTFGEEFDGGWNDTLRDGGQIFSYERQENTAKVLLLYTAKPENDEIRVLYHAISLIDNEEFLATLENPKSYSNSRGGNDKFEAWVETYQNDFIKNGVLESDIEIYHINKSKQTLNDLMEITHDEVSKKYNEFASILRKYNIGGKENAFDKLVNLFLAKIVDEEQNNNNLQFNWKGAAQDTYFDLVDRLQKLYQIGMEKFLDETVTYVAESDVANAFRLKEDAAKDAVLDYFKQLKYFSNNDFSFIEVYNEKLFYQNSKVLVDVIKAFQDMKLKTETQNQFLGDLFEGFLDNGVKQSEGQFFTPLPIVKFIIQSLPIDRINESTDIPKVIDYACGSGHFLNEYANQLSHKLPEEKLPEYRSQIYGIEKEYRLSKVAKVAALMYGQDEIEVIYNDALKDIEKIEDNSFSVVVANPPYSVRGFLGTLTDKDKSKYELINHVSDQNTNNNIELFFVEKTVQLLKPGGVAAIILPSSILTNEYGITNRTRQIILENFNIIAINEFGSKTFGSTGTNTVTLFLQKKEYPPSESNHYKYMVERWFNNIPDPEDEVLAEEYANNISIEFNHYEELKGEELEELLNYELFQNYQEEFHASEGARILNKRLTRNYKERDRDEEYNNHLIKYIKNIESEKMYYFALTRGQNVIVTKTPEKANEMQQFLGYKWSKRRGQEGIRYLGIDISEDELEVNKNRALQSLETPLFNPRDDNDDSKISTLIRNNFNNNVDGVPENLDSYVTISELSGMLDFNQTSFNAEIHTNPVSKVVIESDYPIHKLKKVVNVTIGGTPSRSNNGYFTGDNLWLSIREMNGSVITDTSEKITEEAVANSNVKRLPQGTTLLSFKLSIGKTAIAGADLYTNEAIAGLVPIDYDEILDSYLFALFTSKLIDLESVSNKSFGKSLNKTYLENEIKVPVPPIEIQEEVIEAVEEILESNSIENEETLKMIQDVFYDKNIVKDVTEI